MTHRWLAAALASSLLACAVPGDDETDSFDSAVVVPGAEVTLILGFLNARGTVLQLLDVDVGLDARAARNIIAHRDGGDGLFGTGDDNRFDSLEELDAVSYVGPVALETIRAYVAANPPPSTEIVEGIEFSAAQAAAVIWGVNQASVEELDLDVALDARAARNLAGAAPFASLEHIAAVAYVGPTALRALRAHASIWQAKRDGSAPTASCALESSRLTIEAVSVYGEALDNFSRNGIGLYDATAWSVPRCIDLDDPATVAGLQALMLGFAGLSTFPEDSLQRGAVQPTAAAFTVLLDQSLERAAEQRDEWLAEGDEYAAIVFEEIRTRYEEIRAYATATPAATRSLQIDTLAEECSERISMSVDLETGVALAIHRGPRC